MSVGRKLNAQLPPQQDAPRAPQPSERQGGELRIGGSAPTTEKKRPHVRLDQAIHHHLELNTVSHQLKYQTDGEIDPGRQTRYVIRASSNLTLNLIRSPGVPADQRLEGETPRQREWDVELIIYHAAAVDVTWPSNVIWPPVDDGEGGTVAGTPPPNPRPAQRGDRFLLRYNERTGEWWALNSHAGAEMEDPIDPDEAATLPLPEDPTDGEDGLDDEDIEFDPEAPEEAEGTAYALHTDGISLTTDGGHSWTFFQQPGPNQAFSLSSGDQTFLYALNSGVVREVTFDGLSRNLPFAAEEVLEFPIPNGDFETGDTEHWTVATDDAVSVLRTRTPPQRPGSTYYLTRDANRPDNQSAFQISQIFTVPPSAAGRDLEISVDALARSGATGRLRVTQFEGSLDIFNPSSGTIGPSGSSLNIPATSDNVNLLTISGPSAGLVDRIWCEFELESRSSTETLFERARFWLRISGTIYTGILQNSPSWPGGNAQSALSALEFLDFDSGRAAKDFDVIVAGPLGPISVTVPQGWRFPVSRRSSPAGLRRLEDIFPFESGREFASVTMTAVAAVFETTTDSAKAGQWERLSLTVPGDPGTQYLLSLFGEGEPADVFFDNVTAGVRFVRQENWRAFATSNNRHIVVTEDSVWSVQGGSQTRLAQALTSNTTCAAVEGNTIAYASPDSVFVSQDNGVNWTTFTLTDVVDLHVRDGDVFAVTAATSTTVAAIYKLDGTAASFLSSPLLENVQVRLSFDERRLRWVAAGSDGSVTKSADLQSWGAVNATATLGTVSKVLPWDNGRWMSYAVGSPEHRYTDEPDGEFFRHFNFARNVLDVVELR